MPPRVVMVRGDIVQQDVDAIVNAANTALRPGGGVDGAITRAAGPDALVDRERLIRTRGRPPLPTGTALAGRAGLLRARWIIYTAGPVYSGSSDDSRALARCHRSALAVADEVGAASVAFPAISTGIYGYPIELAAPIAVESVMRQSTAVRAVRFVLYDDRTLAAYEGAAAALGSPGAGDNPANVRW